MLVELRCFILSREPLLYSSNEYVEVEYLRTPWLDECTVTRFISETIAELNQIGRSVGRTGDGLMEA